MASLQDQLIKAGLSSKQKARQANTEKKKQNKQRRSGQDVGASLQQQVQQEVQKQKQEKVLKDSQLNQQKQQQLAEKEARQRIMQILQHHQVPVTEGDVEYNYSADNKIKKLYTDKITQKALANGRLAICYLEEKSYLVTAETAEKLKTLDASIVALLNTKAADVVVEEDDPYAAYQIPDDLMW